MLLPRFLPPTRNIKYATMRTKRNLSAMYHMMSMSYVTSYVVQMYVQQAGSKRRIQHVFFIAVQAANELSVTVQVYFPAIACLGKAEERSKNL